jgi:hypothetical protein
MMAFGFGFVRFHRDLICYRYITNFIAFGLDVEPVGDASVFSMIVLVDHAYLQPSKCSKTVNRQPG